MRKGCKTFLAVILESKRGQVDVEKIPIVREFLDVFPEELPGIPLERKVDLSIEIVLGVDPTRSMGRRDSLLNEKKMGVDFRVFENLSPRRNRFALESPLTFCFYFIKGKTK